MQRWRLCLHRRAGGALYNTRRRPKALISTHFIKPLSSHAVRHLRASASRLEWERTNERVRNWPENNRLLYDQPNESLTLEMIDTTRRKWIPSSKHAREMCLRIYVSHVSPYLSQGDLMTKNHGRKYEAPLVWHWIGSLRGVLSLSL